MYIYMYIFIYVICIKMNRSLFRGVEFGAKRLAGNCDIKRLTWPSYWLWYLVIKSRTVRLCLRQKVSIS